MKQVKMSWHLVKNVSPCSTVIPVFHQRKPGVVVLGWCLCWFSVGSTSQLPKNQLDFQ